MTLERSEKSSKKSCLLIGCGGTLLVIFAFVALAYEGLKALNSFVDSQASDQPVETPAFDVSDETIQETQARIMAFHEARLNGTATEPLVLSGEDLTIWLRHDNPFFPFGQNAWVGIEGDMMDIRCSLPLSFLSRIKPGAAGKYFNAEAKAGLALKDGELTVRCTSFKLGPHEMEDPQKFMESMFDENNRRMLKECYESIDIRDSKLVVVARVPDKAVQDTPPDDTPMETVDESGADHASE